MVETVYPIENTIRTYLDTKPAMETAIFERDGVFAYILMKS
jgi:hypothetical protein